MNRVLRAAAALISDAYLSIVPTWARPRREAPSDLTTRLRAHQDWLRDGSSDSDERRLDLCNRRLRGFDFSGFDLARSLLRNADLRGCTFAWEGFDEERYRETRDSKVAQYRDRSAGSLAFADLTGARIEGAIFAVQDEGRAYPKGSVDVTGSRFVAATGLFGREQAYLGRDLQYDPANAPVVQRWGAGRAFGDFPAWETMTLLSRMPVLAVSNTALIGIILYASIATWYNAQISLLQRTVALEGPDHGLAALAPILREAPTPRHLGLLLLSIVGITLTNILYNAFCPILVQHGSRHNTNHSTAERVAFLSATYSTVVARWSCFLALLTFGGYLVWYLAERVYEALLFFFA